MAETLDPRSTWGLTKGPDADLVFVEVLFHPDLRKVGDLLVLGSAGRDQRVASIGRDEPSFARDGVLRPLGDPCVSRRQLGIAWSAKDRRFAVTALPEARRPLAVHTDHGEPASDPLSSLPPESLVAIGDRVLLRLAAGPLDLTVPAGLPLGNSAPTTALREQIELLARSELPVLVRGETGVGKELVARALHDRSARKARPMLALNCAALPEHLVESELFGHARGAFSGAATARDGLFRAAEGGTLLLDEIGELPLSVQAKLLRVLQERRVRPVGENRELPVDVRLLAATHRPLEDDVAAGKFRADLFARIEAPAIVIPPLRDRRADVPRLFTHFLLKAEAAPASLEAGSLAALVRPADSHAPRLPMAYMLALLGHGFPRNVRELEKTAHATLVAAARTGAVVPPWPIIGQGGAGAASSEQPTPRAEGGSARASRPSHPSLPAPRGKPTREALLAVLEAHDFVQAKVAAELDVSRTTLDKWMREHEIKRPKDIGDEEIEAALCAAGGDHVEAAKRLGISERGLRLRLAGRG